MTFSLSQLQVLGKKPDAFKAYAACIRKEYSYVPHDVYCDKRSEVLETFLKRPAIYGTPFMKDALEEQARTNLEAEIESLRRGVVYGEDDEN